MAKFLDQTGVSLLWEKTKAKISEATSGLASTANVYTKTEVDNKLSGKANSSHTHTISEITDLKKGQANGVASLDSSGKVPSAQLPSYVDDVLEYSQKSSFPQTGETGKIYVSQNDNKTYRWSGSAYVEISASLALGETSSTAYAGDKGKQNADNIAALQTALSLKANASDVELDINALKAVDNTKANASDVYTKSEVNTKLNSKANTSDVYTKTTADNTFIPRTITGDIDFEFNYSSTKFFYGFSVVGGNGVSTSSGLTLGTLEATLLGPNKTGVLAKGGKVYKVTNYGSDSSQRNAELLDESMALTSQELEAILV